MTGLTGWLAVVGIGIGIGIGVGIGAGAAGPVSVGGLARPALGAPVALLLAAAVLAGGSGRRPGGRRIATLTRAAGPARRPARPGSGLLGGVAGRRCAAAAAGLCCLVVVGGWPGLVAGALTAAGVERALHRQPDSASAADRVDVDRDLPLALDLLACALRAGQPPAHATAVVATAIGGQIGAALRACARACALGATAELAWEPLGRLAGAAATARSLTRAAHSGIALAEEMARTAEALRAARIAAADGRIRRAGVLVALPLGVCFLPAFICVGVLPLVAGIAGSALR